MGCTRWDSTLVTRVFHEKQSCLACRATYIISVALDRVILCGKSYRRYTTVLLHPSSVTMQSLECRSGSINLKASPRPHRHPFPSSPSSSAVHPHAIRPELPLFHAHYHDLSRSLPHVSPPPARHVLQPCHPPRSPPMRALRTARAHLDGLRILGS